MNDTQNTVITEPDDVLAAGAGFPVVWRVVGRALSQEEVREVCLHH